MIDTTYFKDDQLRGSYRNFTSISANTSSLTQDINTFQAPIRLVAVDYFSTMAEQSFLKEKKEKEVLQRQLEQCKKDKKQLEEQLTFLKRNLAQNTKPIYQRVFSDNGTSIRIKDGRKPRLQVSFDQNYYAVSWHNLELGCSICRDGLLEEVNQTLVFLWSAYVKNTTSQMTRSALKINRLMQDFFEEI